MDAHMPSVRPDQFVHNRPTHLGDGAEEEYLLLARRLDHLLLDDAQQLFLGVERGGVR